MSKNSKKPVILMGMMGSGKTTIGRLLAQKLNWSFYDVDWEVEHQAAMPIPQIFSSQGEIAFRQLEHESFKIIMAHPAPFVCSLGGGTMGYVPNQRYIKQAIVVWIDAPVSLLYRRVRGTKRPLAQKGFIPFHRLYRRRYPLYERLHDLHLRVTPRDTANSLSDKIIDYLKKGTIDE